MEPYYNQKEVDMSTTITVKNIPQVLYEKLKSRADRNHRSINREIIAIFDEVLTVKSIKPEDMLASARALREKTKEFHLTEGFLEGANREGRP